MNGSDVQRENGSGRGPGPRPAVEYTTDRPLSTSVPGRGVDVTMDCVAAASENWSAVNSWGALHLGNGSESQRSDSSYALPHSWAPVHSLNQTVRTPSRSGDGALPNSDMRGSESFDDKMFHLLTQLHLISGIKKTQESDPLANFLRFLRCLGSGASGFS